MRIIDLSSLIENDMAVYPGDPKVKVATIHSYETHGWELRKLQLGSHTGTHVDAFSHMHEHAETLDDIPLERFFGPVQAVSAEERWPKNIGLLFKDPVDESFFDKILSANPPFIGGEITEKLERMLLKNNIITYTGLVQIDQVPTGKTGMFYGLPLKIKSGDGSPVRAMVILDES